MRQNIFRPRGRVGPGCPHPDARKIFSLSTHSISVTTTKLQTIIPTADRLGETKEYYFSTKLRELADLRAAGHDIINLGIGSPDMPPAPEVIAALTTTAQREDAHGYQPYTGRPELRQAFADWYARYFEVALNPNDEILPLIGSKEGIMHISMAFLNPGDEVLVPNPGYPTYKSATELAGGRFGTTI